MKEVIFFNEKFLPLEKAAVSLIDPGFLCGWGIFETMRSYNEKIVYLDEHLLRLDKSSKLIHLKLDYSRSRLKKIIKKIVRINGFNDSYVRLTLWKTDSGTGFSVLARKYTPYPPEKFRSGFNCCLSEYRQSNQPFLSQIKTASRLLFQMAYLQAKEKGFDEAIILNNYGYISEGSRSNLFFIKDSQLFTPDLECGCLDGVTRRCIFDLAKKHNIKVYTGNFTLDDLYHADEAFLTNSLIGVMPLVSLEGRRIGKSLNSLKLTKVFFKKYNYMLKSGRNI